MKWIIGFMTALHAALGASYGKFDRSKASAAAMQQGRSRLRLGTEHPHGNHHAHARRKNPFPGWMRANVTEGQPLHRARHAG